MAQDIEEEVIPPPPPPPSASADNGDVPPPPPPPRLSSVKDNTFAMDMAEATYPGSTKVEGSVDMTNQEAIPDPIEAKSNKAPKAKVLDNDAVQKQKRSNGLMPGVHEQEVLKQAKLVEAKALVAKQNALYFYDNNKLMPLESKPIGLVNNDPPETTGFNITPSPEVANVKQTVAYYAKFLAENDPIKYDAYKSKLEYLEGGGFIGNAPETEALKKSQALFTEDAIKFRSSLAGLKIKQIEDEIGKDALGALKGLNDQLGAISQEYDAAKDPAQKNAIAQKYNVASAQVKQLLSENGLEDKLKSMDEAYKSASSSISAGQTFVQQFPEYAAEKLQAQQDQEMVDLKNEYKTGAGGFADRYGYNVTSQIGRGITRMVGGIMGLPQSLSFNNDYGATDRLADIFSEGTKHFDEEFLPQPTKFENSLFKDDGKMDMSLLLPKSVGMLTDMAILIGGGMAAGAPLMTAGVGAKTALSIGTVASSFVMTNKGYYDEAIKGGMSSKGASAFASVLSLQQGLLELINPEAVIFRNQLSTRVTKNFIDNLLSGVSTKEAFGLASKTVFKNIVGENIQELSQTINEKITKFAAYKLFGSKFDNMELTTKEIAETVVLTTIASGLTGGVLGGMSEQRSELEKQSLYTASLNVDETIAAIAKKVAEGKMTQTQADVMQTAIVKLNSNLNILPEHLTDQQNSDIVNLMYDKLKIEAGITSDNIDPLFKTKGEKQIALIDTEIEKILEQGQPNYEIDGKAVTKQQFTQQIADPAFKEAVKSGKTNIKITNDQAFVETVNSALGFDYAGEKAAPEQEPVNPEPTPEQVQQVAVINENRAVELANNEKLPPLEQVSPEVINAKFDNDIKLLMAQPVPIQLAAIPTQNEPTNTEAGVAGEDTVLPEVEKETTVVEGSVGVGGDVPTSLRGVKYSDIIVGDKYLEDILSDNKLSEDEKQQVREIFARGVDYFKFDKEGEKKFQEKFSNPEDITDVADIMTGVSAAQQSAFNFYNTKNYDNVKDAVNYIANNPNDYSPKVVKAVKEIKEKLDNPSSSMNRLYAIDVMKELGIAEQSLKEQTKVETVKQEIKKENEVKKADIERRRQEELNQKHDAGYSTIALDYLFTGGRDVILSTDYLLQALVGGFTNAATEINNIRNKYADKLGNIKDDINSDVYNQMMNEIRNVINKNYNDSKANEIFDKILKNATGFISREGNQVSIELDKLNEQNESKINAKYDAELKALENKPTPSLPSNVSSEEEGSGVGGDVEATAKKIVGESAFDKLKKEGYTIEKGKFDSDAYASFFGLHTGVQADEFANAGLRLVKPSEKIKVYRGKGKNVSEGENEGVTWVAEDKKVAENYSNDGNVEEIEVTKPKNPFPNPTDTIHVKGSDVGNKLKGILNRLFREGKVTKEQAIEASKAIDEFVLAAGEESELYSTKTNKKGVSSKYVKALQALGFDGIVQKESYNSGSPFTATKTGNETNTYGIFKAVEQTATPKTEQENANNTGDSGIEAVKGNEGEVVADKESKNDNAGEGKEQGDGKLAIDVLHDLVERYNGINKPERKSNPALLDALRAKINDIASQIGLKVVDVPGRGKSLIQLEDKKGKRVKPATKKITVKPLSEFEEGEIVYSPSDKSKYQVMPNGKYKDVKLGSKTFGQIVDVDATKPFALYRSAMDAKNEAKADAAKGVRPSDVRSAVFQIIGNGAMLTQAAVVHEFGKKIANAEMKWLWFGNNKQKGKRLIDNVDVGLRDLISEATGIPTENIEHDDIHQALFELSSRKQAMKMFMAAENIDGDVVMNDNGDVEPDFEQMQREEQEQIVEEINDFMAKNGIEGDENIAELVNMFFEGGSPNFAAMQDFLDEQRFASEVFNDTDPSEDEQVIAEMQQFRDENGDVDLDALEKNIENIKDEKIKELIKNYINDTKNKRVEPTGSNKENVDGSKNQKVSGQEKVRPPARSREEIIADIEAKKIEVATAQSDYDKARKALDKDLQAKQANLFAGGIEQKMFNDEADLAKEVESRKKKLGALMDELNILNTMLENNLEGQQGMDFGGDNVVEEPKPTIQKTVHGDLFSTLVEGDYPVQEEAPKKEGVVGFTVRTVKGAWSVMKNIQFTGTTKVKSAADVAEIMKLLESKVVEHAFAVHIDAKGKSHVQFLSIGGKSGTVIDPILVMAGVAKFGSKKVYMVHNHPSGNMKPSPQDITLTNRLVDMLDPLGISMEHVIMDTYKKEYVKMVGKQGYTVEKRTEKSSGRESSLSTHAVTDQELIGEPIGTIKSSRDAMLAIQQFRFSAMPKNAMLLLDRMNNVIGNYVFQDGISYKEVMAAIGDTVAAGAIVFYGNQNNMAEITPLIPLLDKAEIKVLDHVVFPSTSGNIDGFYKSMQDEGKFYEHQEEYKTGNNALPDVQQEVPGNPFGDGMPFVNVNGTEVTPIIPVNKRLQSKLNAIAKENNGKRTESGYSFDTKEDAERAATQMQAAYYNEVSPPTLTLDEKIDKAFDAIKSAKAKIKAADKNLGIASNQAENQAELLAAYTDLAFLFIRKGLATAKQFIAELKDGKAFVNEEIAQQAYDNALNSIVEFKKNFKKDRESGVGLNDLMAKYASKEFDLDYIVDEWNGATDDISPEEAAYASTGVFDDTAPKTKSSDGKLSPMEVPELVQLAKSILGRYPTVERLQHALGMFTPSKELLRITNEMFKAENLEDLAKVLAHEIGHAIDFMPDKTMDKGNILGRLASIKGFMDKILPFKEGMPGALTQDDLDRLTAEAKALTPDGKTITMIEEEIEKEFGITADDVKAIWNAIDPSQKNKALEDYIKGLSDKQKALIVKAAMKGMVADELKNFITKVKVKTGNMIAVETIVKGEWKKTLDKLVQDEIAKRQVFELKKIHDEALALSVWWRPMAENPSAKERSYRHSSTEIYADIISVLFNSPGEFEKRAPNVMKAFFNYFDKKPEVKKAYEELMAAISDPDTIAEQRLQNILDANKRGTEAYKAARAAKAAINLWTLFKRQFLSVSYPLLDKFVNESVPGLVMSEKQRLRQALDMMNYASGRVFDVMSSYEKNVINPLVAAGVDLDDMSVLLQARRNIGDRSDIANPLGMQGDLVNQGVIDKVMSKYTPEQQAVINKALDTFYALTFETMKKGNDAGLYSKDMWDIIEKNKDTYATYRVIKYIDGKLVSAGLYEATGTLQEVANPFFETMVKMSQIEKAIIRNNAVKVAVEMLAKYHPDDIKFARRISKSSFQHPPAGWASLNFKVQGRTVSVHTDKYIVEIFNKFNAHEVSAFFQFWGKANVLFKGIYTGFNYSFGLIRNPVKDSMRSTRAIAAILHGHKETRKLRNMVTVPLVYAKNFLKSLPDSAKLASGITTKVTHDMIESGAVSPESILYSDYDAFANPEMQILGRFKEVSKHLGMDASTGRTKMKNALRALGFLPSILEYNSKIASYKTFLDYGLSNELAAYHTRINTGTPDFKERTGLNFGNFMYAKTTLQGLRAEAGLAADPATRAGYFLALTMQVAPAALAFIALTKGLWDDDDENKDAALSPTPNESIKRQFMMESSWDKLRYITIPTGLTEDKTKVGRVKVPMDEIQAFFYGAFVNAFSDVPVNEKVKNQLTSLKGLIPALINPEDGMPMWEIFSKWLDYAMGNNPIDNFRNKEIVNPNKMKAGFIYSAPDMLAWTAGKFNVKFDYKNPNATTKDFIKNNIPVWSAIYSETNFGDIEEIQRIKKEVDSKKAAHNIDMDKAIQQEFNTSLGEEIEKAKKDPNQWDNGFPTMYYTDTKITSIVLNTFTKMFPEAKLPPVNPETGWFKDDGSEAYADISYMKQKAKAYYMYGLTSNSSVYMNSLIDANKETKSLIIEKYSSIEPGLAEGFINFAYRNGIIDEKTKVMSLDALNNK